MTVMLPGIHEWRLCCQVTSGDDCYARSPKIRVVVPGNQR